MRSKLLALLPTLQQGKVAAKLPLVLRGLEAIGLILDKRKELKLAKSLPASTSLSDLERSHLNNQQLGEL